MPALGGKAYPGSNGPYLKGKYNMPGRNGPDNANLAPSPATSDWINRIVTNGGVSPSQNTINAVERWYRTLVAAGVDTKMLYTLLFVPDSLTAAITPFFNRVSGLDPATNHSFVSGDLSTSGLKSNGSTKWLDTGITPNTNIPDGNSVGLVLYVPDLASTASAPVADSGVINGSDSSKNWALFCALGSTTYYECFGLGTSTPQVANNLSGFYSGQRVGAADSRLYFANSTNPHAQIGSTAVGAPGAHNVTAKLALFGAWDINLNNISLITSRTISFFSETSGLNSTDDATLYTATQAMRTPLGGGFV
jgi:hypothetical protein